MSVSEAVPVRSRLVRVGGGDRRYISFYKVVSDNIYESPGTVQNATGVPAYRSHYQWPPQHFSAPLFEDHWSFAANIEVDLIDPNNSRLLWGVTVTHETLTNTNNARPAEWADNPLDREAEWSGSSVLFERETSIDRNGQPMRTSAGEVFGDVRVDSHRDTINVTTYTSTINLRHRYDCVGAVNEALFWTLPVNSVKCTRWDYNVQYYGTNNIPYVINYLEFEMDFVNLWKTVVPDVGHWYKDPFDGKVKLFRDDEGLTNISGPLLANGEPADPILGPFRNQEFENIGEADFGKLPVPATLPNPPFILTP